jgi:competence protein ComEA
MMSKRAICENAAGSMVLLFLLLMLFAAGNLRRVPHSKDSIPNASIYVHVAGDVQRPGVYEFGEEATPREVLLRAGVAVNRRERIRFVPEEACKTGRRLEVVKQSGVYRVQWAEMSAYHKMTLGIPICVNREGVEGLMAIPGIGQKLAQEIVRTREKRGGFRELSELMSVKGIGPTLYGRIRGYLTL